MPNREEMHNAAETLLLATDTASDATPVVSPALDCLGFDSAHFGIAIGATLGTGSGAMTYEVTECDESGGTYTAAPSTSVIDDGDALAANKTKRVAYVGNKRYCKITITPKANDIYTVFAHRGYADKKPVANPI